jgi:hypothetical protein
MISVKQGKSQGAVPAFRSYNSMRICSLHGIDALTVNCSSLGQELNHHVRGQSLLQEALVSLPQDCQKVQHVVIQVHLLAGRVPLHHES